MQITLILGTVIPVTARWGHGRKRLSSTNRMCVKGLRKITS
jgi:hypothetical protein